MTGHTRHEPAVALVVGREGQQHLFRVPRHRKGAVGRLDAVEQVARANMDLRSPPPPRAGGQPFCATGGGGGGGELPAPGQ